MTAKQVSRRARVCRDTAPISLLYGGKLGGLAGEAYKPSKHSASKRKKKGKRK
jgi:hypothetical protein